MTGSTVPGRSRVAIRSARSVLFPAFWLFFWLALANQVVEAEIISLNPIGDTALMTGGLGLAGLGEYLVRTKGQGNLPTPDISQVNAFDRLLVLGHSPQASLASDILQYSAAAAPFAFGLFSSPQEAVALGIVYAETLLFAYGAKNVIKYIFPRYRPYMYTGGATGVDPRENDQSFPSGHATIAFTAASASVILFPVLFPSSPFLIPWTIANYGIAVLTASLRILSGMHFITDVIAGALLGTLCGIAVPLLHMKQVKGDATDGLNIEASTTGLMAVYSY